MQRMFKSAMLPSGGRPVRLMWGQAVVYSKGERRLALFRLVFTKSNRKPSKRLYARESGN